MKRVFKPYIKPEYLPADAKILVLLKVRSYTHAQLAELFEISPKMLEAQLKPYLVKIGKRIGRAYTACQVQEIINCLGMPYDVVMLM